MVVKLLRFGLASYIADPDHVKHFFFVVLSDSLGPYELYSSQNSPGQNTGVGSLSLL